jgi:hypothetical protein
MMMKIRFTKCTRCKNTGTCVSIENDSDRSITSVCETCDPRLYELAAIEEKEAWLRGDLRAKSQ